MTSSSLPRYAVAVTQLTAFRGRHHTGVKVHFAFEDASYTDCGLRSRILSAEDVPASMERCSKCFAPHKVAWRAEHGFSPR